MSGDDCDSGELLQRPFVTPIADREEAIARQDCAHSGDLDLSASVVAPLDGLKPCSLPRCYCKKDRRGRP